MIVDPVTKSFGVQKVRTGISGIVFLPLMAAMFLLRISLVCTSAML